MSVFAEFRAPITSCPLSPVLHAYPDVSVEIDALVPTGGATFYMWVRGESHQAVVSELVTDTSISDFELVDELADASLVRFEWPTTESPVFDLVNQADGRIVEAEGFESGWELRVRFPSEAALESFVRAAHDRPLGVQLQRVFDPETAMPGDEIELSPKQREALVLAFNAGYFDVPRTTSLRNLADELGISQQGVSERLRRGMTVFLSATFAQREVDGPDESADHGGPTG